ncbi:MAG TPA: Rne/Rng family ribonuclease [Actinoplanes sp.]|nr:Rne/Rng family ribonuclease [Actinoplanes sp.]
MLDNEPPANAGEQGGVSTPPADDAAGTTPVRKTRAPRRKAAPPPAETEPAAAETAVPDASETPAPVKKATRARRKKVEPEDSAVPVVAAAQAEDAGSSASEVPAEPVAPVKKATRARRKKVEPVAEQPSLLEDPTPADVPVEVATAPAAVTPATPVETPAEEEDEADLIEDAAVEAASAARAAGTPVVGVIPLDDDFVEEQPARPTRARRAALPPAVLFMPPEATEAAAAPPARRRRAGAETTEVTEAAETETAAPVTRRRRGTAAAPVAAVTEVPAVAEAPETDVTEQPAAEEPAEGPRRSRRRRRGAAEEPAEAVITEAEPLLEEPDESADDVEDGDENDDDEDSAAGRRRRRRGRRGRGRGKGPSDEAEDGDSEETDTEEGAEASAEDGDDEENEDGEGDGVTRRRRRRRRKGSSGDGETGGIEDGVHTVVRVREPRRSSDEVQGVSGSTRLEAKRQRRRDGREQRRTRPPILSESEFLARREAVDRVMVVRQKADRTQIAVLEDGILVEHYVSRVTSGTMVGNVYLGKVQNVLPSMEAAFVDVGRGRNAVLYAGEVNWDATGLEGRARSIEQALRSGDSVLVQVTKDPIGHKGARLTSHIALSGRHLVYVPNGNASGISRKLPDNERKRLRDILKKLVPDGAGVIVRTAAEGATEDELARDVTRLQAQWETIQARATEGNAPRALSEEPDLVIRVVRDLFNEDFRDLVVQGEQAYAEVENYLDSVSPDLLERLRRHTGVQDVFAEWRIDEQILKGLDRKVFLPSGGHLVIDRTEAMTVVDVNTGKYTGAGGNLEETVTRNNLEAAEEIVRQLRLRDLGGIVVIDFIDMVLESNRELVLRRLTECLGRDRTKHQVTEITSLGLVQMTRKRIGAGLLEAFSENCDHCKGRGLIVHPEPVPEKRSNGSGGGSNGSNGSGASTQVKAVAAAVRTEAPVQQQQPASSRSRRRRGGAESAPVEQESGPIAEIAEVPPAVEQQVVETLPAAEPPRVVATPQVAVTPPVVETPRVVETPPVVETPSAPVAGSGIVRRIQPVVTTSDDDEYDMSGYDLSRYDTPAEPMRLVGADDPDAAEDDEDEDDEDVVGAGTGTRRRSRRSAARRRTRP